MPVSENITETGLDNKVSFELSKNESKEEDLNILTSTPSMPVSELSKNDTNEDLEKNFTTEIITSIRVSTSDSVKAVKVSGSNSVTLDFKKHVSTSNLPTVTIVGPEATSNIPNNNSEGINNEKVVPINLKYYPLFQIHQLYTRNCPYRRYLQNLIKLKQGTLLLFLPLTLEV